MHDIMLMWISPTVGQTVFGLFISQAARSQDGPKLSGIIPRHLQYEAGPFIGQHGQVRR